MACIRKRRGKWVLDYRDQQGRRHWETVEGNRKAADERLAQRIREVGRGTYQAPHELVDFEALAAAFLQHAKGTTRETTFKDYAGDLRRNISPYFIGRKIRGIRRVDVEAFRAHLLEKGKGTRTVNKCLTLLGQMCRCAMRHEWLDSNPAEGTKLRASSRRSHDLVESNILAPLEVRALLDACDARWRSIVMTAVISGLREANCSGFSGAISIGRRGRSACGARSRAGGSMSPRRRVRAGRSISPRGSSTSFGNVSLLVHRGRTISCSRTARGTRRAPGTYYTGDSTRRYGARVCARSGFMISATPTRAS